MEQRPLAVDLDGTLIHTDLLLESGLAFARQHPFQMHKPLSWLLGGKARLKAGLATHATVEVTQLPYDERVLAFLHEQKREGRPLILATASHERYAHAVANHLDLFDGVLASTGTQNLSREHKRDALVARYGHSGFDYIGNSRDDLCIWASANKAYVANAAATVQEQAQALGNVAQIFPASPASLASWGSALRLHQWLKNLLVFVPLLASHQLLVGQQLAAGLLAFLLFGLCASSVYLLNDLLDLADDRAHNRKRHRPFASGRLPLWQGLLATPLLLLAALMGAASFMPAGFVVTLSLYYLLTLAYSLYLKHLMTADVITLASLYTLRIIAGTFAFGVQLTFWMLAFSLFIFLSLALVKRYAELREARLQGKSGKTRGYYPDDLEMISSLGAASGYIAVMVLALYIQDGSTAALYRHPQIIWLACPLLLFWISRTWLLTHRGQMHDDPVVFAIRDRVSLLVGILFGLIFWLAS